VRHLPDIDSGDFKVRGEAERQAINSPVQSFASDMCMIAMILIQEKFERKGIEGPFISTVHDALYWEVRNDHLRRALPIIKNTMENLPLEKMFGVVLDVPIKVDIKLGPYWGEARELTDKEIYDYRP
jgi:DNA polymerase-1